MLYRKSNYVLMLKGVRVESKFPLALLEKSVWIHYCYSDCIFYNNLTVIQTVYVFLSFSMMTYFLRFIKKYHFCFFGKNVTTCAFV